MENCKHGIRREYCADCRDTGSSVNSDEFRLFFHAPLDIRVQIRRKKPKFGVTLRKVFGSSKTEVFWDTRTNPLHIIDKTELDTDTIKSYPESEQRKMLKHLRKLALNRGLLFIPERPLTRRELQTEPAHCSQCGTILSKENGVLGCKECNYYVCPEGFCMCGSDGGVNWLNQYYPPQPSLPITQELRAACVNVVLHISAEGKIVTPKEFKRRSIHIEF